MQRILPFSRSLCWHSWPAAIAAAPRLPIRGVPNTAEAARAPGGARNCGFWTNEQCMATVSGIGGYCEVNAMYRGPSPGMIAPPHAIPPRARRR
jgi:hypothetical protein